MKRILPFFLLCLLAACSKDDDNAARPNGNGTPPELEVYVLSNHRYPYLRADKDGTPLYWVNDTLLNTENPYYSMQTVLPGTYTISGTQNSDPADTNLMDNVRFWKHLIVILRGDTIANYIDSADANYNINRYFVKVVN